VIHFYEPDELRHPAPKTIPLPFCHGFEHLTLYSDKGNTYVPFKIQPPCFRSADDLMPATSLPANASVTAKAMNFLPAKTSSTMASFNFFPPKFNTGGSPSQRARFQLELRWTREKSIPMQVPPPHPSLYPRACICAHSCHKITSWN